MDPLQQLLIDRECERLLIQSMWNTDFGVASHTADLFIPAGVMYVGTNTVRGQDDIRAAFLKRFALTSRRKPRPGDMLVLAEPLTFTDGQSERSFRVIQSGKKTILRRVSDGMGVKISKLMSRAWTIVPAPAAPSAP